MIPSKYSGECLYSLMILSSSEHLGTTLFSSSRKKPSLSGDTRIFTAGDSSELAPAEIGLRRFDTEKT